MKILVPGNFRKCSVPGNVQKIGSDFVSRVPRFSKPKNHEISKIVFLNNTVVKMIQNEVLQKKSKGGTLLTLTFRPLHFLISPWEKGQNGTSEKRGLKFIQKFRIFSPRMTKKMSQKKSISEIFDEKIFMIKIFHFLKVFPNTCFKKW